MLNQSQPEIEPLLILAAMDAGHEACEDDGKPFQCFKCDKACDDWEGSECETCGEFFCDDCLVEPVQAMAPECCHACADESMTETYRMMPKGRD